jgi:hypothetical protein
VIRDEFDLLIGRQLPAGVFCLPRYQNWLAHDALYSTPTDEPHPLVAFLAVRRGLGLSPAQFFALLGIDMSAGPMLLECTLEFPGTMQTDVEYEVTGQIVDVQRKHGRKLGVFDLVVSRFWIRPAGGGDAIAIVTNRNAIPRKEVPT